MHSKSDRELALDYAFATFDYPEVKPIDEILRRADLILAFLEFEEYSEA